MPMTRDDWGFSEADHAELQALMQRHAARVPDILRAQHTRRGVRAKPDDAGLMWALLQALRDLEADDGS
jgi:hypothetical protein